MSDVPELPSVLSLMFRRVPLERGSESMPGVGDWRPIDVFSLLFRVVSSVQVDSPWAWKQCILHPGQYASRRGAVAAMPRIGHFAEAVLHKKKLSGVSQLISRSSST